MANEVRLIDMNTLWQCETCFHNRSNGCNGWCDAGEGYRPAASKFKIIDPESLRLTGRWIKDRDGDEYCENCSRYMPIREVTGDPSAHNYCPNSGAKMRGEADDE